MAFDNPGRGQKTPKIDDEEFLNLLAAERRQSIGFEHDNILLQERERALNYFKGQMDDMPNLPNRSGVVSTDVADAIETVLPDLIEIFVGGDDVLTFKPTSAQDEPAAKQETKYVNQVVFHDNDGFMVLYSMIKDALQSKTGVAKWWWEDKPIKPEFFEGKSGIEMLLASQDGKIEDVAEDGVGEDGQPTYSFTLTDEDPAGDVKIQSVPPEDFTVARDTVKLADTTYCAFRTRPRAQDLIEQGIPEDVVRDLPPYGETSDEVIILARDQAGEHEEWPDLIGDHNLRTVEVVEHYLRVDADEDGKPELWRILTGGGETILIEKEQVDSLPFAAITPFIITHRFYGESVADRMLQIQQIKTALIRMMLDSGYFAMNQRVEVADDSVNQFTIQDLLRNEPGMPVRVKKAGGVNPIKAGELGFDVFQSIEFASVMGEQRTGIVRNAQGLNPETLHDTAAGMEKLMMAAQLRMRLIARVFAETGIKDLMLGVHGMLRKHGHQQDAKIGGNWTPVDCSKWAERTQMSISLGLGSAGRTQELGAMQMVVGLQEKIIQLQGGTVDGPFVDGQNVYNAITRLAEKAGEMAPEMFFSDPSQAGPQPPKPPPGAAEAQAKSQTDMAALQQKGQQEQAELAQKSKSEQDKLALAYAEAHDKDQRERLKLQMDHERELMKLEAEMQMRQLEMETKRADVDSRLQLEQQKLQASIEIALIQAQGQETSTQVRAQAEAARMSVDLELQEHEHAHEADQARQDRQSAEIQAVSLAKATPKPGDGE